MALKVCTAEGDFLAAVQLNPDTGSYFIRKKFYEPMPLFQIKYQARTGANGKIYTGMIEINLNKGSVPTDYDPNNGERILDGTVSGTIAVPETYGHCELELLDEGAPPGLKFIVQKGDLWRSDSADGHEEDEKAKHAVKSAEQEQWDSDAYDREEPAAQKFCEEFFEERLHAWFEDEHGVKRQIDPDEWISNPHPGEMLARLTLLRSGLARYEPNALTLEGRTIYVDEQEFKNVSAELVPLQPTRATTDEPERKARRKRDVEAEADTIRAIRSVGNILRTDPHLKEEWKHNKHSVARQIREKMIACKMSESWIYKLLNGTNKAANDLADENQMQRFWPLPSS
jgi:hypothetical protein